MKINKIAKSISPANIYRNVVAKRAEIAAQKAAEAAEKADQELLRNNPVIAQRRKLLAEFMSRPQEPYKPLGSDAWHPDMKVDQIINNCNDNLPKIKHRLGEYGLAHWASLDAKKVVSHPQGDIVETGIVSGKASASLVFNEYIIANPNGTIDAMYERLGELGKIQYERYKRLGYMN